MTNADISLKTQDGKYDTYKISTFCLFFWLKVILKNSD